MADNSDTITQLNSARSIVLKDAAIYPQVVNGVLPVIGPERPVELRRWGADFLAETFASPVVSAEEKQSMCFTVLDTLKSYLLRKEENGEDEDWTVVKSAVQCAASIYPLVFRHTATNVDDAETWGKMASMKSSILRRMDSAPGGVRVCCIKFVASVVLVQTQGVIADPRRPEQNEISLALVPRDHKLISYSNLEAEASGLLDRLLGVLQDNISDPLIATATLNALSSLVQRRPSIAAKILSTVLAFNPLTLAGTGKLEGKDKVAVRSMTRTTMSFLTNVYKRNPTQALAGRIQHQIERLRQTLTDVFSEHNPLKRGAPDEPVDGLSDDKRQKLDREAESGMTPQQQQYPPLPPGPVSGAQLWTLTNDSNMAGFHAEAVPQHVLAQIIPPLLSSINSAQFEAAINVVRARYLEMQRRPPPTAPTGDEEDDDYDPDMGFGDGEQIANQVDQLPPLQGQPELATAPFHFPSPPPLTEEERTTYSETAKDRLFITLHELDTEAAKRTKKPGDEKEKGFSQLAATGSQDRDGWVALLTRLATRPAFESSAPNMNLDGATDTIKRENEDRALTKQGFQDEILPDKLRAAFHTYILDDWRRRLDIAIAWLNEEWYAEKLASPSSAMSNYTHLTLHFLDALLPYIDTKDGRYLIRLLSEIPYLPSGTAGLDGSAGAGDHGIWTRIEKLAEDPERVSLAAQTLLYLAMLRPPVRNGAVECAVRIWRENKLGRAAVGKMVGKYRPEVLQEGKEGEEEKVDGAVKGEGM
ncbi:uncharacterized protein LTR77_001585 [Saxophila tyrrhenica]|uniref:Symplekin/Pta1 N-terminal domain-containing protein n=1 Tax=Saxophila tyrrhenica TaxID=1690608 RepID=A0AAV9PKQ3_9PEZI|nr:hypothetical protein LTR77_001585 [Saxophila tyrrhenica]